jgi:hypothetical protein
MLPPAAPAQQHVTNKALHSAGQFHARACDWHCASTGRAAIAEALELAFEAGLAALWHGMP